MTRRVLALTALLALAAQAQQNVYDSNLHCVWAKKVIGFSNEYDTGSCGAYAPFAEPDDWSSCSALGPPSDKSVADSSRYCSDSSGAFTWNSYDESRDDYLSLDFQRQVPIVDGGKSKIIILTRKNVEKFGWVGKVQVSNTVDSTTFSDTVFDTATGSVDGTSCITPGHTTGSTNILEIPLSTALVPSGYVAGLRISPPNPQTSGDWMYIESVGICYPPGGDGETLRFREVVGKTWGDPHFTFGYGGVADFRGQDQKLFNLVSAPNFSVSVRTVATDFIRWGGQLVHGSFITELFVMMRSPKTGAMLRAAVSADTFASFRSYLTDDPMKFEKHTRVEKEDMEVLQLSGGRFVAHGAGWEVFVNRRRLRKPVASDSKVELPAGHASRSYLDISFFVLDGRDESKKFGKSTVGFTAPHGIIGQSFDGSLVAVSGKLDTYGSAPEFTTSAQMEGAIEGNFTEYMMQTPFATNYKYSRFDATGPIAPRNVSTLTGTKTAVRAGTGYSAGSKELHGVE